MQPDAAENQPFEALRIERSGPVAEIVLCRPQQANAFDDSFWRDFPNALKVIGPDPSVRVLLLRSTGKHFSAGMHLGFFPEVSEKEGQEAGRYREWLRRKIVWLQESVSALERLRVPVIAVVQGGCIGAALDLLCATDLRYCSSDAFFKLHETKIGMTADLGVLQRLPCLLPDAVAREMAFTGRAMSGDEATRLGFVNGNAATPDAALEIARQRAKEIASLSPLAVAGTKAALSYGRNHGVDDGLTFVSLWNAAMFACEDVPNAIAAQKSGAEADFDDLLP